MHTWDVHPLLNPPSSPRTSGPIPSLQLLGRDDVEGRVGDPLSHTLRKQPQPLPRPLEELCA